MKPKQPIGWFQQLSRLSIFKTHFVWGPVNSFLLLLGVGATLGVLAALGRTTAETAAAAGFSCLLYTSDAADE